MERVSIKWESNPEETGKGKTEQEASLAYSKTNVAGFVLSQSF